MIVPVWWPSSEAILLDVTPLSIAVECASFKVLKLLFENGGSTKHGQLLHYVADRRLDDKTEILAYLVDKGLGVNDILYQNRIVCYTMQKNWSLGTPLHYAANRGRLDAVKWLLDHGANPRMRDSLGQLPIERAHARDHHDVVSFLRPITESAAEPSEQFTSGRRGEFGGLVDPATIIDS